MVAKEVVAKTLTFFHFSLWYLALVPTVLSRAQICSVSSEATCTRLPLPTCFCINLFLIFYQHYDNNTLFEMVIFFAVFPWIELSALQIIAFIYFSLKVSSWCHVFPGLWQIHWESKGTFVFMALLLRFEWFNTFALLLWANPFIAWRELQSVDRCETVNQLLKKYRNCLNYMCAYECIYLKECWISRNFYSLNLLITSHLQF